MRLVPFGFDLHFKSTSGQKFEDRIRNLEFLKMQFDLFEPFRRLYQLYEQEMSFQVVGAARQPTFVEEEKLESSLLKERVEN